MTKISPSPPSHLVAGNINALSSGSVIDEYIIERVLAKGGFSTVYLARQLKDQQQVAIKEYNPKHLVEREGNTIIPIDPASAKLFQRGRELFLKEATLLTTLKHPNIVRVINFFLCNNTAYLVMNYDYGITLGNWLKNPDNLVNTEFLLGVFQPVMRCIKNMHHRGLLHLDIKPDNILLRPLNNPLILDFGSALPYKDQQNRNAHSMTKGYAAPEQYNASKQLGPWSDCYSIGCSMRVCLDRTEPLLSTDQRAIEKRPSAHQRYKPHIDEKVLYAIDWAMQYSPSKRPQSIDDLLNATNYR